MTIMQLSTLDQLIDDVLLELMITLPLPDLLTLRQTCKRLFHVTKLRIIWYRRLSLDVLSKELPIPGPIVPVHCIPSTDLEWRTRKALQLEKSWKSPPRRYLPYTQLPASADEIVRKVILLHGTNNVVTALENKLQVWQVDATGPQSSRTARMTGEWMALSSSSGLTVVRDSSCTNHVAVQSSGSINILSVDSESRQFASLKQLETSGALIGLFDNYVLINKSEASEGGASDMGIVLLDWRENAGGKIVLPWNPEFGTFIGFTVFSGQIVIAWDSCLVTFPLPTTTSNGTSVIEPLQAFRFRQRIRAPITMSACRSRELPGIEYPNAASPNGIECLTIIANWAEQSGWGPYMPYGGSMTRSILYVADKEHGLFGMASIPLQMAGDCEAIAVGPSGRGVWIEQRSIRQCSPKTTIAGRGVFRTVECDDYSFPLASLPGAKSLSLSSEESKLQVDFDDGMGRIAVVLEQGVHVYDLV
ncbi:hypothetical protein EUX98_g3218 [Antrodiella citrinella]|uniref:F-box domain-containing protein n=1 Tax=Antrodiella citrinella TaxID=2447956 RepID=A0A4S4MX49_9APHY|nr:hypothetical protein EUX98_g3218 [Antrodiella citrinella]